MRFVVSFLVAVLLLGPPSHAQQMRKVNPPDDCLDLLNANPSTGLLDWRDLVEVEHCDRIKRLQRIAALRGDGADVEFYDGEVLASELPPDVDVRIPILRVVFRDRVFFNTDSSELRPEAYEIVDIVAHSLRFELPDVALFVAGHADARGDEDYNLNLSVDRANALAEAVMSSGVNQASVWRIGFGEDLPLVAGSNPYAWGQNRRIEFLFAARSEALASFMVKQQIDMSCQGKSIAETDECRRTLNLKENYDIIEVASTELSVSPNQSSSTADVQSRRETVAPATRKIRIDPTNGRYTIVNPVNNNSTP